ncbi:MAG: hypothetical protein AMXMBFR51_20880 [Ignavibacteriota bacterium]
MNVRDKLTKLIEQLDVLQKEELLTLTAVLINEFYYEQWLEKSEQIIKTLTNTKEKENEKH